MTILLELNSYNINWLGFGTLVAINILLIQITFILANQNIVQKVLNSRL
jgi:hypothetical protein